MVFTVLTIVFIFIVLVYRSYWSKEEKYFDCINSDNYHLIRESPFSEECSTYKIYKKEHQIWFKDGGYSLFYIESHPANNYKIELIGLASYGVRNPEFKKYICKLVHKIKAKHNEVY